MFMMIGGKRCPKCGIHGKKWKTDPKIFICPECNAYFNEFGFVTEPQIDKEVLFS